MTKSTRRQPRAHRRFATRGATLRLAPGEANATADFAAEADQATAMMTLEMGGQRRGKAEALKCAKGFRYYAENAEALLLTNRRYGKDQGVGTADQPLGAVMPMELPCGKRFGSPHQH